MASAQTVPCSECGTSLTGDVLGGMCPWCLLDLAQRPTNDPDSSVPHGAARLAPKLEELANAFPDLEILEVLGSGGMATVYKARQPRLNRLVALKVLCCTPEAHTHLSIRFEQEAQVLAQLHHPLIVGLYEFGEIEEGPMDLPLFYFLMEYVEGTDLETRLRQDPPSITEGLAIISQLCEALAFAHRHGVIHRDIKPANLLLDPEGRLKVADFGIAKITTDGRDALFSSVTLTGSSMGTPYYMAPEMLDHPDVADARSDLYATGVVLHQLLTGERPTGLMTLPSRAANLPRFVDRPVMRALERDPEKRIASAKALGSLVRTTADRLAKTDQPATARIVGSITAVVAGVGLIAQLIHNDPLEQTDTATRIDSAPLSLTPPPPLSAERWRAAPGRLVAFHTGDPLRSLDLTPAEPYSDFVQVHHGDLMWIGLREDGTTVSMTGHADRERIRRICPGLYSCFALIDENGRPEFLTETGFKHGLQNDMPAEVAEIGVEEVLTDEFRALALLRDGTVRAWGEAYDQPELIPRWTNNRGPWMRPPVDAFRQVTAIGMGFSWDATITADGRLWIWGRDGQIEVEGLDKFQGRFARICLQASDNIDAELDDGSVVKIHLAAKWVRVREGWRLDYPMHHCRGFLMGRDANGRWRAESEIPLHRQLLDPITGWPSAGFSLELRKWNPDSRNSDDVGSLILISAAPNAPNDV